MLEIEPAVSVSDGRHAVTLLICHRTL